MPRQSELGEGASDKIHTHNKTHHDHTVKIIGGSGTHVQTGRKTELDGRREQNQRKLAGRQQCVHTQQNQGPRAGGDERQEHRSRTTTSIRGGWQQQAHTPRLGQKVETRRPDRASARTAPGIVTLRMTFNSSSTSHMHGILHASHAAPSGSLTHFARMHRKNCLRYDRILQAAVAPAS